MENTVLIEPPSNTKHTLESAATEQSNRFVGTQQLAIAKVSRKRTKTGCLTCRQRRIKCGEEKPICNNCTKSKRECKGYAQRLIFKNPLGLPGVPNSIPPQPVPSTPNQYEGQLDFQLTSAGTQGPMLAPKLPAGFIPQNAGSAQPAFSTADNAFAKQFNVPAQSLMPEPPSAHRHSISSATVHQGIDIPLDHVPNNYDYPVTDENRAPQGSSGTVTSSQYQFAPNLAPEPMTMAQGAALYMQQPLEFQRSVSQSQFLSPKSPLSPFNYVERDEDGDYYDVESDEEEADQVAIQNFNQLGMVMASASRDVRSFTTYLNEPNMLETYVPTLGSSPFNNPKSARIFLHFIHATGPALSIFERHGTDRSTTLGVPVPMAQQGLWTYTLPLKAFQHQALQQAILALGCLHIEYLQGQPSTASLKHYQYALRRVGKAVGLPNQRKQVGTLAATLLLAYYEVMTADHTKWNNHLAGSAQLIREIDWAGITRNLRAQRRNRWIERSNNHSFFDEIYMFNNPTFEDDPFAELETNIDQDVIGRLIGRAINYDQFGEVEEEHARPRKKHFTRKDIENFRTQCDLYWWYCKQDWLQSIISAGPLFLPYSQWGQCPPRAGLGMKNDLYGTADHLTLLMGRLSDFAVRDRKRKLEISRATGSSWKPDAKFGQFMARFAPRPEPGQGPPNGPPGPPGSAGPPAHAGFGPPPNMGMGKRPPGPQGPNSGSRQSSNASSGSSPRPPPFYGMIPSSGPKQLPAAFADTRDAANAFSQIEEEINASFEEAESEWESIIAAFDLFAQSLGPDFSPLAEDATMPVYSPFGLAIQYHTLNMASLMAFYYTARILLFRLHPSMPPWMQVATGYAANLTGELAQKIGRIAAGIHGAQISGSGLNGFSPTVGSCLIEVTVPIFFAAPQYMDPEQRAWIITALNNIARLTGWQTASTIARGCERTWITAAEQGRGPPYERREGTAWQQPAAWKYADAEANQEGNTERRYVTASNPPLWAMGVLSLEDRDYEETK
ncbi:putative C6 finger domain protein [Aspergillus stella-maris]|uniref:putative C6 finger domain protein n=1 Tax=Aspergillus stella-maris TaxID=1810926 RepID=UPI003CCD5F3F